MARQLVREAPPCRLPLIVVIATLRLMRRLLMSSF